MIQEMQDKQRKLEMEISQLRQLEGKVIKLEEQIAILTSEIERLN